MKYEVMVINSSLSFSLIHMNCLKHDPEKVTQCCSKCSNVQVRFGAQKQNAAQWHPADVHLLLSELSPAGESTCFLKKGGGRCEGKGVKEGCQDGMNR